MNKFNKFNDNIDNLEARRNLIQISINKSKRDKSIFMSLAKQFTDACTGLIWHDDAQVVSETTNKYYSENPRIEIEVGRIDELKQPEA